MYKIICFDFDDTLFDYAATEKIALKSVFTELDIPFKNVYISRFKDINRNIWAQSERDRTLDKNTLRLERFRILFEKLGIENAASLAKNASDIYIKNSEKGVMIDGVADTIPRLLEMKYTLMIASSGLRNPRIEKLNESVISDYFTLALFREDFGEGKVKPNRAFFDNIASRFNVNRNEILFVGNDFYNDVKPAKESGFDTVWFNYFEMPEREVDITYCDYIIYSFEEILNKVGGNKC